jgi:hypothetical protein
VGALQTDSSQLRTRVDALQASVGTPLVASTVSQMTDHDKIYVYVGSETGYTSGNWYYWNGSAWTSGGVYNSTAFETDKTLTLSNKAADAKVTGDEIADLKSDLDKIYKTNVLYDEATKIVSGTGTYVFEDIFEVAGISVGDIYSMSIGSVTGNLNTNVGYIDAYDSNDTRLRRISLSTKTSLTQSITVASGETKLKFVLYPSTSGATTATYTNVKIYKGTTAYEQINPDLLEADEVSDVIGDISEIRTQSIIEDDLLSYTDSDRYNPNDATLGVYINPSTGAEASRSGYCTTDYMPIRTNETLYFFTQGTRALKTLDFYAGYDKNKNFVSGSGGSNASSVTQSGNVVYIRASFTYSTTYFSTSPEALSVLPINHPFFLPWTDTNPTFAETYAQRKTIYIYGNDTEAQVIEKLVNAYKVGNCDVQFERAIYTFGDVLPNVKSLYKLNENEIPIGNNCRYFFNGSKLVAEIDLSTLGINFYCNLLGSQRFPSSYELNDGILISTDTRYVVHDEASGYDATYRRVYRNMQMEYITNARTEDIRKCIGGGTGKNGVIDIEGCKFTTDGTDPAVSYHGNASDVVGSKFNINARNNWFSNRFTIYALNPEYQTGKLFFTGNSTDTDISSVTGWDITSFGNEIRN